MDFERERGEIESRIDANIGIMRRQVSRQLRGVEAMEESRIQAASGPNLLALGLDIATGVAGGYATIQANKALNKDD